MPFHGPSGLRVAGTCWRPRRAVPAQVSVLVAWGGCPRATTDSVTVGWKRASPARLPQYPAKPAGLAPRLPSAGPCGPRQEGTPSSLLTPQPPLQSVSPWALALLREVHVHARFQPGKKASVSPFLRHPRNSDRNFWRTHAHSLGFGKKDPLRMSAPCLDPLSHRPIDPEVSSLGSPHQPGTCCQLARTWAIRVCIASELSTDFYPLYTCTTR